METEPVGLPCECHFCGRRYDPETENWPHFTDKSDRTCSTCLRVYRCGYSEGMLDAQGLGRNPLLQSWGNRR